MVPALGLLTRKAKYTGFRCWINPTPAASPGTMARTCRLSRRDDLQCSATALRYLALRCSVSALAPKLRGSTIPRM